ncbi:DNA polymerase iota [Chanos chanos]|uniref:DNA polymerase iota n=1 Tax=Chanos chanos TaxID=29144 RepID=A0A6J2WTD4_CHACN|nr:DNA polymerase iota [Chanos chanos]
MIRNPSLRDLPLGIQQKYIIVTSNYVARQHGVTKLMSVSDAKEKCPQLVLVNGEDLTCYREMSYKVTDLLMSHCPLVERLGFDENFVDVTELVESRLKETPLSALSFVGHIYNQETSAVSAKDYPRLAIGSHIAAELRDAVHTKLGLTGCAGIASNKLLAKLVSGAFKPNQQTTLLPECTVTLMHSLSGLRRVPGVGPRTAQRLQALGLHSVSDLQLFPLVDLVKEFGEAHAKRIQNLARGIDVSMVTPTGPPQSLSDEDSFKKMSTMAEVSQKIEELLASLIDRMHKDGRQPMTFRLTIRRLSTANKWFNRESRQCPIPSFLSQKIALGSSDVLTHLVTVAVKLFHKLVDTSEAFHLTLINVCFCNLQSRSVSRGSIASFFSHKPPQKPQSSSRHTGPPSPRQPISPTPTQSHGRRGGSDYSVEERTGASRSPKTSGLEEGAFPRLPPDVDPDVFKVLPQHIQEELLSNFQTERSGIPSVLTTDLEDQTGFSHIFPEPLKRASQSVRSEERGAVCREYDAGSSREDGNEFSVPQDPVGMRVEHDNSSKSVTSNSVSGADFPHNVDPCVFSQLPADMQRELLSEWRQQKPIFKMPSRPSGTGGASRDKKTKGPQTNNLLKYFKPS